MRDLIRRQDAIDAIVNTPSEVQNKNIPLVNQYDGAVFRQIEILGILGALPTAEPDRKKGKWIEKKDPYVFFDLIPVCSECGCTNTMRERYNFCPNCGADMRVSNDER